MPKASERGGGESERFVRVGERCPEATEWNRNVTVVAGDMRGAVTVGVGLPSRDRHGAGMDVGDTLSAVIHEMVEEGADADDTREGEAKCRVPAEELSQETRHHGASGVGRRS